eukprot:COSAG03_NODE_469_length_7664_cov_10.843490_7_plen_132_part_00
MSSFRSRSFLIQSSWPGLPSGRSLQVFERGRRRECRGAPRARSVRRRRASDSARGRPGGAAAGGLAALEHYYCFLLGALFTPGACVARGMAVTPRLVKSTAAQAGSGSGALTALASRVGALLKKRDRADGR